MSQRLCLRCALVQRHEQTHIPFTQTYMHTNTVTHTPFSHLQPGEVMKTNGRVLFPLGSEEELSHQANFILVWPRDSISSGCFYKCRAAPRHRPVMDMRAWWPDGRCWPCNSSSKHSLMTPPTVSWVTHWNIAACVQMQICALINSIIINVHNYMFQSIYFNAECKIC